MQRLSRHHARELAPDGKYVDEKERRGVGTLRRVLPPALINHVAPHPAGRAEGRMREEIFGQRP